LIYPIVFGYRQFLELTLKAMIEEYGPLGGVPPVWSHHRLEDLSKDFERLLRNWGAADQEDGGTDAVQKWVAEFARMDPTSAAFRFPKSRKGEASVAGFDGIDLLQLREIMLAIETYFMCVEAALHSKRDAWGYIP
jgi:hypothetical protein